MKTIELDEIGANRTSEISVRRFDRLLDSTGVFPILIGFTAFYLLLFVGYPIVYNVVLSLQEVTVSNLRDWNRPWAGLDNYLRLVKDPIFLLVFRNTVIFAP